MQKMAAGIVRPVIDTEVDFDGIGTALKRMEGRDVFGKIILRVADASGCQRTMKGSSLPRCPRAPAEGQLLADRAGRRWPSCACCGCCRPTRRSTSPTAPRGGSARCSGAIASRSTISARPIRKRARTEIRAIAARHVGQHGAARRRICLSRPAVRLRPAWRHSGRIEVEGVPHFERDRQREDRPHIIFTGHLGNFELLPIAGDSFRHEGDVDVPAAEQSLHRRLHPLDPPLGHGRPDRRRAPAPRSRWPRILDNRRQRSACWSTRNSPTAFPRPFSAGPARPARCCRSSRGNIECDVYPARCIRLPGNRFRLVMEPKLDLPRDRQRPRRHRRHRAASQRRGRALGARRSRPVDVVPQALEADAAATGGGIAAKPPTPVRNRAGRTIERFDMAPDNSGSSFNNRWSRHAAPRRRTASAPQACRYRAKRPRTE